MEILNNITVSNTPKFGEVILAPPTPEMALDQKITPYETSVEFSDTPVDMSIVDIKSLHTNGYGPYGMRLLTGDNSYAISCVGEGLRIVDIKALKEGEVDLLNTDTLDNPVERNLWKKEAPVLAFELATSQLEEGQSIALGNDAIVQITLKDGKVHFERLGGDKIASSKIYYNLQSAVSAFENEEYGGMTYLVRQEYSDQFEKFRKKADKVTRKRAKKIGEKSSY